MRPGERPSISAPSVPVFVFPTSLAFLASEPSSHKQVLTLYNPYDFPLTYKVLSTAPQNYSVVDPEGTLQPRRYIDIVIRHIAVRSRIGHSDRFRIFIHEEGQREPIGKRDLAASVYAKKAPEESAGEAARFQGVSGTGTSPQLQHPFPDARQAAPPAGNVLVRGGGQTALLLTLTIGCAAALSLPNHGDPESSLPPCLYLTLHQKLFAAFVLGLLTSFFLRQ